MFKKVIIKIHFQPSFNDIKHNSCHTLSNLDSMSVLLANAAKLAFFNRKYLEQVIRVYQTTNNPFHYGTQQTRFNFRTMLLTTGAQNHTSYTYSWQIDASIWKFNTFLNYKK